MVDLTKIRAAAQRLAGLALEMDAEIATLVLVIDGNTKYHLKVERVFKAVGRAPNKRRELQRETVTVRQGSQQGDVIYASPLEWLGEVTA